jgi:hypothetical protein
MTGASQSVALSVSTPAFAGAARAAEAAAAASAATAARILAFPLMCEPDLRAGSYWSLILKSAR